MRTQLRIAAIVNHFTFGIVALAVALALGGCSSGGGSGGGNTGGPTAPNLSAAVSGLGSISPGEMGAVYTITVSNGAGAASTSGTVTMADPPTNFTATGIAGTTWTCTLATLTCTNTNVLAAGSSYPPITVTGNVTGAAGQTVSVPIALSGGGLTTTINSPGTVPIVSPPTISKAFSPTSIGVNAFSALTFTIANPAANTVAETGVAFTDNLPSNLVVATPNGLANTCGGTSTAAPGSNSISLTGGTVGINTTCTLTVNVTSAAVGSYANTTGAVSSTNGGTGAASNTTTLSVVAFPTISKAFGAPSVPLNGSTSLSFTVANPAANTATLTNITFADTLPAGLLVASPNGLVSTCSGTPTATAGSSAVNLTGVALAPNASCILSVNVTGTSPGAKSNTTGAISSTQSGAGGTASASLAVVAPPTLSKAFGLSGIPVNGVTTLTFSLTNPAANTVAVSGVSFTDTFPAGIQLTGTPVASNTCGGTSTAVAGTGFVSLSGVTLATSSTCTLVVNVTATQAGSFTNTTASVSSTNGGTGLTASSILAAAIAPTISKAFGTSRVQLNQSTSLTFTITSPGGNTTSLTNIAFSDSLTGGLQVAGTPNLSNTCGGTAAALGLSVTLSGATLTPGAQCTVSLNVIGTQFGSINNTTSVISSAQSGNGLTSNTATLTVVAPPVINMSFASDIPVGGSTTLSYTITNPPVNTIGLTGIAFSDTLPTGILEVSTPNNGLTGSCGSGTITAVAGSNSVSLSGGTLGVGAHCTFSVSVTGTAPDLFINDVTNLTSTEGGPNPALNNVQVTILAPPVLTQLSSNSGLVGSSLTITGQNFDSVGFGVAGGDSVTVNGFPANVTNWISTSITVTVPAGATGAGNVVVTVLGVPSNGLSFTIATSPPTISLSLPAAPPLQAGQASSTMTISVTNDLAGDLPTVGSFTLGGAACTPSTCGSFGSVTGTAGSGSYSAQYTPPASLTASISPTVTVSPSVTTSGQPVPASISLSVNPAGVVVTEAGGNLNIVQAGSAAKLLTFTVYNDVNNAGVLLTLEGNGYSCANLSTNSCGVLGTPQVTTSGTTTTITVQYTPPAAVPAAPYNRPAIQATSVADPTKSARRNFLLSATPIPSPLSILFGQKFDSALTGGSAITVSASFTDATSAKSATWNILANGVACAAPTCGTLGTPAVTSNGNSVTSTVTYTPPTSVPSGSGQATPTITATMSANSAATDSFSFKIVDGSCGTGKNSLLNGSYAFLVRGGSASSGYIVNIGSFTADGNGNITNVLGDINQSNGAGEGFTTTGFYSVGSDNRGCMTLLGIGTYRIAVGTVSGGMATQGTIVNFGDSSGENLRAEGVFKLQNLSNVTSATFNGTYAFGREGMTSTGSRYASAGLITSNGAGGITNLTLDFNNNGSVGTLSGGSGTYSLATNPPSGRGTVQTTITTSNGVVISNYAIYVISPSDFFVMSSNRIDANHPIESGENLLQTGPFSTSGLNGGGYVFYAAGINPSSGGSDTVIGQSQFTTSGNATVTIDENTNGVSQTEVSGPATFVVPSTGRMTASGAVLGYSFVAYQVDSTQAFLVGLDPLASSGYIQKQAAGPFSTATISGAFFYGGSAPTDGGTFNSGITTFTSGNPSGTEASTDDGSGPNLLLSCTQSCSGGGLLPNQPSSSVVYNFTPGALVPSGQGNIGGQIAYIISPSKLVYMHVGTSQNPNPPEIFIVQQ